MPVSRYERGIPAKFNFQFHLRLLAILLHGAGKSVA
jgi:hypothetical protein